MGYDFEANTWNASLNTRPGKGSSIFNRQSRYIADDFELIILRFDCKGALIA